MLIGWVDGGCLLESLLAPIAGICGCDWGRGRGGGVGSDGNSSMACRGVWEWKEGCVVVLVVARGIGIGPGGA